MSKDIDFGGIIGALGSLIKLIADALGESTADVAKRVAADAAAKAKDPSDETDKVSDAIDADMPSEPGPPEPPLPGSSER